MRVASCDEYLLATHMTSLLKLAAYNKNKKGWVDEWMYTAEPFKLDGALSLLGNKAPPSVFGSRLAVG